jgi:hypothetical protein
VAHRAVKRRVENVPEPLWGHVDWGPGLYVCTPPLPIIIVNVLAQVILAQVLEAPRSPHGQAGVRTVQRGRPGAQWRVLRKERVLPLQRLLQRFFVPWLSSGVMHVPQAPVLLREGDAVQRVSWPAVGRVVSRRPCRRVGRDQGLDVPHPRRRCTYRRRHHVRLVRVRVPYPWPRRRRPGPELFPLRFSLAAQTPHRFPTIRRWERRVYTQTSQAHL